MRKVADFFIHIYLLPLRLSTRLAMYVKGMILQYDEHFVVTIDVIKRKFANSKGVIVDVGAYDGDSAIYFAKYLPHIKVMGFEPNPVVYQRGIELTKGYKNISLFNFGFSNFIGKSSLFLTKNQVSSSLYDLKDSSETSFDKKVEVDIDTLDNYFKDEKEVLLIKLDVQGAELKILQSGTATLAKTRLVLTEVQVSDMYDGGCFYFEIDAHLRAHGFALYTVISNYNNEGTKYFDILYANTKFLPTS